MARNDRIARLFRLLNILARSKRGLPLSRIAEQEGWPLRSLYRDLEALDKAGFPVVGQDGRYKLMEGWVPATQLGVDGDELLALYLARQQAAGWKGSHIGEALERLYGKLATPAKGSGSLIPTGLGGPFSTAAPAARDYTTFRNTVAVLDRAARDRLVVDAVYESVDAVVTKRAIEPAQLHWDPRLEALYLIAWCRLRTDIRVFATHRFKAVSARRESFEPRPEVTSDAALRHAFRVWRTNSIIQIRLRFSGRGARLVAERRWHPSQRIRKQDDGSLVFEAGVAGLDEITPWILSFGPDCTVLEPANLRERIRDAHASAAEMNATEIPRTRPVQHGAKGGTGRRAKDEQNRPA